MRFLSLLQQKALVEQSQHEHVGSWIYTHIYLCPSIFWQLGFVALCLLSVEEYVALHYKGCVGSV